jgi:hypothetical protein
MRRSGLLELLQFVSARVPFEEVRMFLPFGQLK